MRQIIILAFIFCVMRADLCAQAEKVTNCQRQYRNQFPLTVIYDRIDNESFNARNVIFRVTNQSSCDLVLYDQVGGSLQWSKQPSGGIKFDYTDVLLPERVMAIVYDLKAKKLARNIYSNSTGGCLLYSRFLPAGQATLVSVPLRYFKKHRRLWLEFDYSWRGQKGYQTTRFIDRIMLPKHENG